MARLILNCDLGENEDAAVTAALLQQVDAANVCCGAHAGSPAKTAATLALIQQQQIQLGAHPGLAAAGGRGDALPSGVELRALLSAQLGDFYAQAAALGLSVGYVKLHGSLYNAVEREPELLNVYLDVLLRGPQPMGIFALAGGRCATQARACGIQVWAEAFADRAYQRNGQLVPRQESGAVLEPAEALIRIQKWLASGRMPTVDGGDFKLQADTLCVHADSPGALPLLQALRKRMN